MSEPAAVPATLDCLVAAVARNPDDPVAWDMLLDHLQETGDAAWGWMCWARRTGRRPFAFCVEGIWSWWILRPRGAARSEEDLPHQFALKPTVTGAGSPQWRDYPTAAAAWSAFIEAARAVPFAEPEPRA